MKEVGHSLEVLHLIHSLNPSTGGVLSAVQLLNEALLKSGVDSRISDDPNASVRNNNSTSMANPSMTNPSMTDTHIFDRPPLAPGGVASPSNLFPRPRKAEDILILIKTLKI